MIEREFYICALKTLNKELLDALISQDKSNLSEDDREWLVQAAIIYSTSDFAEKMIDFSDIMVTNYRDSEGNSLLHYAAASQNSDMINLLLKKGLDLEARNSRKATPICIAAKEGNLTVLKIFEKTGADLSVLSNHGENLLITAAGNNPNPEITEYLVKKKLWDIEYCDEAGFTALQNAALHQSNPEILRILVRAGANPYVESPKGDNLLHLAVRNKSLDVVKFIASNFTTRALNDECESVVQRAVLYGQNPEVVRYILEKNKREILFGACFNDNPEILKELIKSDYDINTIDELGRSLMMCCCHVNDNPEIIKMLWEHNSVWNNRSNNGRTILHYAAANENHSIYDFLLLNEAIKSLVDVEDNHGHKASYYLNHAEDF